MDAQQSTGGHRYTSWVYLLFSVLIFLYCEQVHAQNQVSPEITKDIFAFGSQGDRRLEVGDGKNIALEIEARGSSTLFFVWTHDGSIVKNTTSRYLDINSANTSQSGSYRCKVENKYGSVLSLHYEIVVKTLGEYDGGPSETSTVSEGGYVLFDLQSISHVTGAFRFSWRLNGNDVNTADPNYYQTLSRDLAVLNIPQSFNGNSYNAWIQHVATGKKSESHIFVLDVSVSSAAVPPAFVVRPQDVDVNKGSEANFECVINASPNSLNVVWYRQRDSEQSRSQLSPDSKYRFDSSKRRLTVANVGLTDVGRYECEGQGSGGTLPAASARLTVYVKPTIQSSNARLLTKDFQETLVLPCEVQGSPTPQISWYFNAKILSNQSENGLEIFPNGTLAIPSVDLPDSGVYQCFGTNVAGEIASYTQLIVNSAKPELLQRPVNKTVIEHQDTDLTCKVYGGPQPLVYWTKDAVNLTIGGRIRLTADQLLIGAVVMSDAGLYTCHAVNIKGSISADATIVVVVKTQIDRPPQNMSRIVSTDARLECGVRQDPSVTVTWNWYFYKAPGSDRQEILSGTGNKNILPDGTLVIGGVVGSDSGKYVCTISSSGGDDQRTATLNVIDLPAKPSIDSVTLYDAQPNSVLINWTLSYNGDTTIIKFVIQIRQDSSLSGTSIDSPWVTKDNNVDQRLRSLIVGDLLPARYYRFRIIAVNSVGDSDPSNPAPVNAAIKMPSQPPGEPPKNLFCRQGQEREIVVQWEPPPESSWNGEVEGYIVYYKVERYQDNTQKEKKVLGKDTRETTLTSLAFYKKYRIFMTAYNDKGPGVNSTEFYVTTLQGRPSQPPGDVELIAVNSTSITAKWLPPSYRELNGVNLGYDLEIYSNKELKRVDSMRFDEENPTGLQSFDIVNLRKYTQYEIRIACRTVRGAGPFSAPKSMKTLEDIPGPVSALKIDNIRDSSLRINWRPPTEINGILTGYKITYYVKSDPSTTKEVERNPSAVDNTLVDLRYETTYIITVQAKTAVGLGPPSTTEIESGVNPELPGPASNLAVSNIKSRSVLLQFIQGNNGKTSILLWIIQAEIDNSGDWKEIFTINDPEAYQITVKNLKPFTQYRLRIIKKNIVGLSDPSEPCDPFQTMQDRPDMPPSDVTPRAVSPTSIRIRWRQIPVTEWNGNFIGYRIFYRRWSSDVDLNTTSPEDLRKVRNSTWTQVSLKNGNNIQEYTLTNLEEWLEYEIQMYSFNAVGSSQPSPSLFERTNEDKPSGNPMDVDTVATSSTSIKVTWKPVPVLMRNGHILGYKVKYIASLANAKPQYVQVDGADTLNVTLNDLRKFVFYSIQILAFNRMGDGVLSTVNSKRTAGDVPGPPVIIYFPHVSETSATVHWQAPDEPNGYIIEYRVSYKRLDQPDSVFIDNYIVKKSNVFEHTIDGLSGETYYIFSVEARTEDGWGESSYVKVYTFSNRALPDAPTNVRIDQNLVLSRSMAIFWSPGDDNYGPIRNFTVQYKLRGGTWDTVDERIGPDATQYSVAGLKPNMEYSFRVAATNDIGRSNFSSQSPTDKTDSDVPDGAPQGVAIKALSTNSIKITWTAPPTDTWNSDYLMGYRVRYKQDRNPSLPSLPWDYKITEGIQVIATELIQGEKYICSVQATNYKGGGPWSSAITAYMELAPQSSPMDVKMINMSSTEIKVSWNPPPPATTNGELTGYKVSLWKPSSNSCGDEHDVNVADRLVPKETNVVIDSLRPYTYYCSTVQALNIAGEGPNNVPLGIRTSEDKPGRPASMTFANISLDQLVVMWESPVAPNGVIIRYQLDYRNKDADISRAAPGNSRELLIMDLREGERYTFSLTAYTIIGPGKASQSTVKTGPQEGSPENPIQLSASLRPKSIQLQWVNQREGNSPINAYEVRYEEEDKPGQWMFSQKKDSPEMWAKIPLSGFNLDKNYRFRVRAVNEQGISEPSPPTEFLKTPKSLASVSKATPFHEEWWFLVIVALSSVIVILLLITLLCYAEKKRTSRDKMKRSATNTTVMSEIHESEDGGFPSLQMRQSRRSMGRAPKPQSNIYALSPPRPSPASITYSDDTPPMHMTGAIGGAMKPPGSDDTSSEISEKPSRLGDSSADSSDDSDDSSTDSIAKAPIPASPPPPAFSSHYNKGYTSSNGAIGGASGNSDSTNEHPWRSQNTNNAYAYTDSEAESSHYAFSLNNGNIVVNNVAGARTPLSGFSSFV